MGHAIAGLKSESLNPRAMRDASKTSSVLLVLLFVSSLAVAGIPAFEDDAEPLKDGLTLAQEEALETVGRGVTTWAVQGTANPQGTNGPGDVNSVDIEDVIHVGNGVVYIVGSYRGDVLFGNNNPTDYGARMGFVAKLDSYGQWGWVITPTRPQSSTGGSHFAAVDVDSSGDIFVCGWVTDEIHFGSNTLMTGGAYMDGFAAKYDISAGAWDWAASWGGSVNDIANDCSVTSAGGLYVGGVFRNTANIGASQYTSEGGTDMYLLMVDSMGGISWTLHAGGNWDDNLTAVEIDAVDNVYAVGYYRDNMDVWPNNRLLQAGNPYNGFVMKVNPAGTEQWTREIAGGSGGDTSYLHAVTHGNGKMYVGGQLSGEANFRSGATVANTMLSNASATNGFVSEISYGGVWGWATRTAGQAQSTQVVYDLAVGPFGSIAMTGVFADGNQYWTNGTFGDTEFGGAPEDEIFLGALDGNGQWMWADRAGGEQKDTGTALAWIANGQIVGAGVHCAGTPYGCGSRFGSGSNMVNLSTVTANEGAGWIWSFKIDTDFDTIPDLDDNCPLVNNTDQSDIDGDLLGDLCDDDRDADGYDDYYDQCLGPTVNWDQSDWYLDRDQDGCHDANEDADDDGDGVDDVEDACDDYTTRHNWTAGLANDYDRDGCHDADEDDDDDGDGVADLADDCPAQPYNRSYISGPSTDHDGDGCSDDTEDDDDDADGILDAADNCPRGDLDWVSDAALDHDGDGCRDAGEDLDDDADGVVDQVDSCTPMETGWTSAPETDKDGDGCLDATEDADDDGDGLDDGEDACPRGDVGWISSSATDNDGDGCRDAGEDIDDDNDMITDTADWCPQGETGWTSNAVDDWDGDGCVDATEDTDDDNDGYSDEYDACPRTPEVEWPTVDNEGCGTSQGDSDDDGIRNDVDNCPDVAAVEGFDQNFDGCTDDIDGDGYVDPEDACPNTPEGEKDNVDAEGCGYLTEQDADDDGILDTEDVCPGTSAPEVRDAHPDFEMVPGIGCWSGDFDGDFDASTAGFQSIPGYEDLFDDDGFPAWKDACPGTEVDQLVNTEGCSYGQQDADSDGVSNALDVCPLTYDGFEVDENGCSADQLTVGGEESGFSTGAILALLGLVVFIILGGAGGAVVMIRKKQEAEKAERHAARKAEKMAAAIAENAPLPEPQTEPAVEAEAAEDDGITTDEHGTEWYQDDAGTWWYRTPEMSDWAEHQG